MTSAPAIPRQRWLQLDQRELPPMLRLPTAQALIGAGPDEILELIEGRALCWAWNVGLGSRREELRVLTQSLAGYLTTGVSDNLADLPSARARDLIFAGELRGADGLKPFLSVKTLKWQLDCEETHVYNLMDEGELRMLPGAARRRGPGGSALVERKSVEAFLARRRK